MTDKPKWWQTWWLPYASGGVIWLVMLLLLGSLAGSARCRDGWASPSIGRQGACSSHGGVKRSGGWVGLASLLAGVSSAYWLAKLQTKSKWTNPPSFSPEPQRPSPAPLRAGLAVQAVHPKRGGPPPCPTCGAQMVKRVASRGRRKGRSFWGCSGFPTCTGTRNFAVADLSDP